MITLDEWKSGLAGLPAAQRAELAHYLLESLESDEANARADWLSVASQRMADVHAGKVVGIPSAEVLNSLVGSKK